MTIPPEYAENQRFILAFLDKAPELGSVWDTYAADEYELVPTSAMYDLARGIVQLLNVQLASPNASTDDALKRIFAFLEMGMEYTEESPIPNLIRLTMCDWLGRQSPTKPLYEAILGYIGPQIQSFLVTADGKMPFWNDRKIGNEVNAPEARVGVVSPRLTPFPFEPDEVLEVIFGAS